MVTKAIEGFAGDSIKLIEAKLGSAAGYTALFNYLKAHANIEKALAAGTTHDEWMRRIDEIEKCAQNPTNPLTRKAYEQNPAEKQRILDLVASTRAEVTHNTAAIFLGLLVSVGGGLTGQKWLGFVTSPGAGWSQETLSAINDELVGDLDKAVTDCGGWTVDAEFATYRLTGEVCDVGAPFTLEAQSAQALISGTFTVSLGDGTYTFSGTTGGMAVSGAGEARLIVAPDGTQAFTLSPGSWTVTVPAVGTNPLGPGGAHLGPTPETVPLLLDPAACAKG